MLLPDCSMIYSTGGVLEQTVGVSLMTNVQLAIRGWGYRAVEFALGIGAIAAVTAIAKLL